MGRTEAGDHDGPVSPGRAAPTGSDGHGVGPPLNGPVGATTFLDRHRRGLGAVAEAYLRLAGRHAPRRGATDTGRIGPAATARVADVVARLDRDRSVGSIVTDRPALDDAEAFLAACILLRDDALATRSAPTPMGLFDVLGGGRSGDSGSGGDAPADEGARRALLAAFASLDDRDRVLVWITAAEGVVPAGLASLLGVERTDAVAAATHRARSRLVRGYAQARSAAPSRSPDCIDAARALARGTDTGITPGRAGATSHPDGCDRCGRLRAEAAALPAALAATAARAAARFRPGATGTGRPDTDDAVPANGGPRSPSTGASPPALGVAPVVISTTPPLDRRGTVPTRPEHRPAPGPSTAGRAVTDRAPDRSEATVPDRSGYVGAGRNRPASALGLAGLFVVITIALALAVYLNRPGPATSEPGEPGSTSQPGAAFTVASTTVSTRRSPSTTTAPTSAPSPPSTVPPSPPPTGSGATPWTAPPWSAPVWTPPPGSTGSGTGATTPTATSPPTTTSEPVTTSGTSDPPTTDPPVTDPPATDPPAFDPDRPRRPSSAVSATSKPSTIPPAGLPGSGPAVGTD